jgi:hypothetical protein
MKTYRLSPEAVLFSLLFPLSFNIISYLRVSNGVLQSDVLTTFMKSMVLLSSLRVTILPAMPLFNYTDTIACRSQGPRGLRRRSATAWLLVSRFRIPLWICIVSCVYMLCSV